MKQKQHITKGNGRLGILAVKAPSKKRSQQREGGEMLPLFWLQ